MPAINFKKQFAEAVRSGEKTQTIRPQRKKGTIRPGLCLTLYTGQRTKYCELLRSTICKSVTPIAIDEGRVFLDCYELPYFEIYSLATSDGFKNTDDFFGFFKKQYGLPFHGVLIKWD